YRASQAGVEIQINVRGICALRPGVRGVSDRITVTSVVGRFLEHSRIYSFERHGEAASMYIGSADLMPRNLYNRVELVIPVEDEAVRQAMLDILDLSLADNTGAWTLDAEGEWRRRRRAEGEPVRDVQAAMIERSSVRAAEPQTL
ncbi:MAG TPA: restriction endonuclease PLD domain-containing protein, partial [Solirubrobacterales bacterium]|nr:restriction endonuclease PLD domain-containing protein [Solirubrobacterales bacterium]